MKARIFAISAAALLAATSACSSEDGDGNNIQAADENASADMMNDPNNPFAQTEMQMNERMMAAVGADPSDTWVRKIIEHHRGAVEMSNIVLGQTQDERVRRMAQMTIDKQTREIQELEELVRQGATPSPESASLYRAAETEMHDRMMAARGATIDETWMRKMIEHHRGGIALSDIVLANNPTPQVREQAQKTKADQLKEIGDLEAMLRGEDLAQGPATAPAEKRTPAPASEPKAAPPKAAPKAAPKTAPKEEPKAAEPKAPASGETCAPEHRAAGHC